MAEQQVGFNRADLQAMLEAVVKAAKEPSAEEKERKDKERELRLRWAREQAEIAKREEENKWNKWIGCPHSLTYNGRKFVKWWGGVCSDGIVYPVCNLCQVEAPPFSAKLLPDEGKQGVNFEQWIDASREKLAELHRVSVQKGWHKCERKKCFVCHPEANVSNSGKTENH